MDLVEKVKTNLGKVALVVAIPALMAGCGGDFKASFGGQAGFRYSQKKECHYHANEKHCHPHDGWHEHNGKGSYHQRRSW